MNWGDFKLSFFIGMYILEECGVINFSTNPASLSHAFTKMLNIHGITTFSRAI